jgi:ketosteroid isomerase-like protein
MDDPAEFLRRYERATNSHDIARLAPLIAADASYWFTDGSHHARDDVLAAIARTFRTITDETYSLSEVAWLYRDADHVACRYRFRWSGTVDGRSASGAGRGTAVLIRSADGWQVQHEHLSH